MTYTQNNLPSGSFVQGDKVYGSNMSVLGTYIPTGPAQTSGTGAGGSITGWDNLAYQSQIPSSTQNNGFIGPVKPANYVAPTTNTGGTGGGNPNPNPAPSGPSAEEIALNNQYDAIMGYLNQAEQVTRDAQGNIISGIQGNYDTSVGNMDRSQQAATAEIAQSQQGGEQRRQDALVAARRLYNELMMGGQHRFGGASSAGEAYGALTGREMQRNTQQIGTDYSTFMGQVATAKNNLKMQYQNSLATLVQQKNDALRQAERDYNDKLLSISRDKSTAAGAKAQNQLSLLQSLRNNVYAINLAQAQNTGTLQNAYAIYAAELANYEKSMGANVSSASAAGSTFNDNTSTNYSSNYSLSNPTYTASNQQTGRIATSKKYDDLNN